MRVEEEGELRREIVHGLPGVDSRLDVGDPVRQREGDFLHGGAARLADVIAADADRVPVGHLARAVVEQVRDQAHRRLGREDIRAARDVLLQNVVLHRPAQLRRLHALLLADRDVHRQQDRRRGVDRHAGRDLVQRDALEQPRHVAQRGDAHAHLADLAQRHRVIGVVADLGGQVERHAQPGLPGVEQEAVAGVGLLGGGVARVLAHGPQPPAIHRRLHAARERVFAGKAQVVHIRIDVTRAVRQVDAVQLDIGRRGEGVLAFGKAADHGSDGRLLPVLFAFLERFGHGCCCPPDSLTTENTEITEVLPRGETETLSL